MAAGRCMYSWVGWGGACINVHANLQMKDMLRCACIHGWGGVGEVGACINVHVNLHPATPLL